MLTISGILRRISASDLVVQSDDQRILTVQLSKETRYYKASGGSAKTSDLAPGDHVNIDATKDDDGYYHARNVNQVKQGTAEERAAASKPVDSSPIGDADPDKDDGPPRLRRAPAADDSSPASPQKAPSEKTPPQQDRRITPQITAADPTDSPQTPAPREADDPGPPRLRRGAPERSASRDSEPSEPAPIVAENRPPAVSRPTLHADEINGVTQTPRPPQTASAGSVAPLPKTGDPVIDKAREAAYSFSETLPNYMVKQFTTRYQTEAAHGDHTSWQVIDTVSADVVSEGGRESYKNVLVNGKVPKEAVEKTGAWSTGEFSSVLLDIFSPTTAADFHNRRSSIIASRPAYRYDFSVDQPHSHWKVYVAAQSYNPEYTGSIWIDKENSRVLRIEMSARNMPTAFPLDTAETAVDYDYVRIGDNRFLLPVHSESLSCERGSSDCSRNVIDFRNYRKFEADTSVTFDAPPDQPEGKPDH